MDHRRALADFRHLVFALAGCVSQNCSSCQCLKVDVHITANRCAESRAAPEANITGLRRQVDAPRMRFRKYMLRTTRYCAMTTVDSTSANARQRPASGRPATSKWTSFGRSTSTCVQNQHGRPVMRGKSEKAPRRVNTLSLRPLCIQTRVLWPYHPAPAFDLHFRVRAHVQQAIMVGQRGACIYSCGSSGASTNGYQGRRPLATWKCVCNYVHN